jgi:hypothetical protein
VRRSVGLILALLIWSPGVASAAQPTVPWGPSTPLVRGTTLDPREFGNVLYRGDDGSLLVAVRTPRGVVTAVRPAGGGFGAPRVIRTGRAMAADGLWPRPVVGAGGRSLLLWQPESGGAAGALVDPVNGPRRLQLPAMHLDDVTSVAMDGSGEVTIVAGVFGDPLRVVTGRWDDRPLRAQTMAAPEEGASLGYVASSRRGAVVAWNARVRCADPAVNGCIEVRAAVRPPGSTAFGPATTLDAAPWAGVSAPRVEAMDEQLIVTWGTDDPRTGGHAVRVAVAAGGGFLPARSVPGTETNTIVDGPECGPSTSSPVTMIAGQNPIGVGVLPGLLVLRRQDTFCGAALEVAQLTDAGEPSAPRPLPGLRTGPNEAPRLEPGPGGRALIVGREGRHLTFGRLGAAAPVSLQDAEYVASGWDGPDAIVVAEVRCGPRLWRTDAWVLGDGGTRRARVWPCQSGQPPMELDGTGHLVLVGLVGRNRFVARASCRLVAWVARPRAGCRPPRA